MWVVRKREKSKVFLNWATGRMKLPFIRMGKIRGGTGLGRKSGV